MILRAGPHRLELGARPLLMGILNATPDSFSEERGEEPLAVRVERGRALIAAGADLLDIGGESARGDRPAVSVEEEIERVCGLIAALAGEALISVDTYKPEVAAAAIEAGAAIVNDVSGLRDPRLAEVCAATGAGLVLMHTAVAPKGTLLDPATYEDVVDEVVAFLRERMEFACAAGVDAEQIVLDPGPDFAKTPAQTVADPAPAGCDRGARAPDPARRLAQGLRRRDHGPGAGRARSGHAGGAGLRGGARRLHPARARRRGRAGLPRGAGRAARRTGARRARGIVTGALSRRCPPHLSLG